MKQSNSLSDTGNMVLCAVCAAITCILAPLSIPLAGGVPISLATFAVMLAGVLLGGSLGAASQLIYVLLGAVGLPRAWKRPGNDRRIHYRLYSARMAYRPYL